MSSCTMDPMDPNFYRKLPIRPPRCNQGLKSTTFKVPPLDGSLTLAQMYDWHYKNSPNHPVFEYADDDGEVTTLRMSQVVPAIHRGGRIVRAAFEAHTSNPTKKPVVGILAASDTITSSTMLLAVIRAGYIAFPISTRNSVAAVIHLLTKTNVEHLVVGPEEFFQRLAHDTFKKMEEQGLQVPSTSTMPLFDDVYRDEANFTLLPDPQVDIYDVALYLHSSGSTAYPKPIAWTYYHQIMMALIPYYGEQDLCETRLSVHSLPMYHGMGISQISWVATAGEILTAFAPQSPARIPTPDNLLKAALDTKTDILIAVPTFIETWTRNPEQFQSLLSFRALAYGGSPLQKEAGDKIRTLGVDIYSLYGFTEAGVANPNFPVHSPTDWEYFTIADNVYAHFEPHENGLFELVLKAGENSLVCIINTMVDGIGAYATSDLLAPHPTMPGYWKVFGRVDDQIMHSTGEKTNPGPLEKILREDTHVQSSVMFGRNRFNAGVLVDPKPEYKFDPANEEKLAAFRNAIWPTIERMNDYAPQHSRIFKEMILVASPSKPFEYTGKNDPRRQYLINLYESEINKLYNALDESAQSDLTPPSVWNSETSRDFVRTVISRVTDRDIGDNDDLFQSGCDSLQATWIRNSLMHALRETARIDTRTAAGNLVYEYPTISTLAEYVAGLATNNVNGGTDSTIAMLEMVNKYSVGFPNHIGSLKRPGKEIVLVTGTTGGLGSSLLATLAQSPDVTRVYAFNRKGSTPLRERQKAVLKERGYNGEAILASPDVILLEANMEEDRFGLSEKVYDELRDTLTLIIHNAWPVNFNYSLSSFEPSVKTVRGFIDLALSSPYESPTKLLFISSVGVLQHLEHSEPIKEVAVDSSAAAGMGYSESKWISEQLLDIASKKTALRPAAIRVGQMTGSLSGAWKSSEWAPSMIKSSAYLGCVPQFDKKLSWIPVDITAQAVFDMRKADVGYLHLAHPRPVSWSTVIEPIAKLLDIPMVPYDEWLAKLIKSGEGLTAEREVEVMRQNPALKLMNMFTHIDAKSNNPEAMNVAPLDVSKAQCIAPALSHRNLPQLGGDDASRWIAYWKKTGFL